MDLLVKDESPSQISDKIKDQFFSRTAEKIQNVRPQVNYNLRDPFDDEVEGSRSGQILKKRLKKNNK